MASKKYNPNMARKIARTKDVDATTRRVNNAAARKSRAKAKDNVYKTEQRVHDLMKEKQSLMEELAKLKVAYVKKGERLPPKKRATDPYLGMVMSDRLPKPELPASKKCVKRAKNVEKFLRRANTTAEEVDAVFEDV